MVLDQQQSLGGLVPLGAPLDQLQQQGLHYPPEQHQALHEPALGGMPDEGVRVVEEVQHPEQPHLAQLGEFLFREQVLVLVGGQPPEVGETLDGGLLVGGGVGAEGPFDRLHELIGEVLAEGDDEVDYPAVHVGVVQQRPQLLQGQFLVVSPLPRGLFLQEHVLEGGVYGVPALPHQAPHHRLDRRQRYKGVGHLYAAL